MKKESIIFYIFKFVVNLIILVTFINGVAIAIYGIIQSFDVYYNLFMGIEMPKPPIVSLVKILDGFLISLVFVILSFGFMKLFHPESGWLKSISFGWLKINHFSDLKNLLWDTVLLALVVTFGASIISHEESLTWSHLIIPGSVCLLALASKFLKH